VPKRVSPATSAAKSTTTARLAQKRVKIWMKPTYPLRHPCAAATAPVAHAEKAAMTVVVRAIQRMISKWVVPASVGGVAWEAADADVMTDPVATSSPADKVKRALLVQTAWGDVRVALADTASVRGAARETSAASAVPADHVAWVADLAPVILAPVALAPVVPVNSALAPR
jgi:hypothetical protein